MINKFLTFPLQFKGAFSLAVLVNIIALGLGLFWQGRASKAANLKVIPITLSNDLTFITLKPPLDRQITKPVVKQEVAKINHKPKFKSLPKESSYKAIVKAHNIKVTALESCRELKEQQPTLISKSVKQVSSPNSLPKYPYQARVRGLEGDVLLKVLLNERGAVQTIEVLESSGHLVLDQAAVLAIRKWQLPQLLKRLVIIPIKFKLT